MKWSTIALVAVSLLSLALCSLAWASGAPPDPLTDPGWYLDALRGAVAAKAWAPASTARQSFPVAITTASIPFMIPLLWVAAR